jgi:tetratricopeptide (TPR) repeat protein
MKEGRWDEALARAEELLALRSRVQGAGHHQVVDAGWRVKTLRRVAALPEGERAAFLSAIDKDDQAESLNRQGKYAEAQPLSEQALAIRRRLFSEDHPLTASAYNELASNLDDQGKYADAQPLYEKALAIRRRLLGDDHPLTALSYNDLASSLDGQGDYAAAQPLYEKALAIRRRLLGDDHSDTAQSYNNLAYSLDEQGNYAAAQPLFEKALAIRRRLHGDDHSDTAQSYNNLAYNLNAQGKYAAAQPLYEKALAIRRRLHGDDHPLTANSCNNVAANLNAQGKYAEAQPLYEQALAICRRLLGDHPHTAISSNNVAANLNAQGKYAEAQPLYEQALAICRRLFAAADHPLTAAFSSNLADNLGAQGKYAAAQVLYEQALAIRRRLLSDDHPDTASCYNSLAGNLGAKGRYAEAQPLYEKALESFRRLLGDDHPRTAQTYSNLAGNLGAQGKYTEARDQWLRAAKSFEKVRLLAAFTGLDRATATTRGDPLVALAAVLARLGQPAEAWRRLEEHLGRGLLDELAAREDTRLAPQERARLRQLVADLEQLDRLVEAPMPQLDQADRRKRLEELRQRRDRAQIALGELQSQLAATHGTSAGRVAALAELQSALPADAGLVAWVDLKASGPNAADPDGEHWGAVVRARGAPAWVRLPGTGPDRRWTADDTELTARVRAALIHRPGPEAPAVQPLLQRLRAQRLAPLTAALDQTADGLPAARRLVVLPSDALTGVPIEALLGTTDPWTVSYAPSATVLTYLRRPRSGSQGGLLALGDPLFRGAEPSADPGPVPDHGLLVNVVAPGSNAAEHGLKPGDVLLSYNGAALLRGDDLKLVPAPGRPVPVEVWRAGQRQPVARRELGPGELGVVLDSRPAPQALAERRRLDQALLAARSGSGDFRRLPGTRYEVGALAQLFASARRPAQVLTDAAASELELDRMAAAGDLRRFAFIHLATHGVIDEAIPQRSAVILTQTGLPDPLEQVLNHRPVYDGRLTVREIQRGWDLQAELVTLSACETARGRSAGGEGFVGFAQALVLSGARGVCLSLWKVDDTATALLMRRFYANLLGVRPGLSQPLAKAEALGEAKAWLRGLGRAEAAALAADLFGDEARGKGAPKRKQAAEGPSELTPGAGDDRPFAHPYYWAAFVLVGDPD